MGAQTSIPVLILYTRVVTATRLENTEFPKLRFEIPVSSGSSNPTLKALRDDIDTKITNTNNKITALEAELTHLNGSADAHLNTIKASLQTEINALKTQLSNLNKRLTVLAPSNKKEAIEDAIAIQQFIATQSAFNITTEGVSKSLIPALPNVVPNTTIIPTGCIYDVDKDGHLDSTYTGDYVYNTRSYTETVDFIDNTAPPARTILQKAPVVSAYSNEQIIDIYVFTADVMLFCVDDYTKERYYIKKSPNNTHIYKYNGGGDKIKVLAGGVSGLEDGKGVAAKFKAITDISIWKNNIYVCHNNSSNDGTMIRKITFTGDVTTSIVSIPKGPGQTFYNNFKIDSNGNFFVFNTNCIQKITPTGTISIFAGSVSSSQAAKDGIGITEAKFVNITFMSIDSNDNLYVIDSNKIRKIGPDGYVSTFVVFDSVSTEVITYTNIMGFSSNSKGVLYLIDIPSQSVEMDTSNVTQLMNVPNTNYLVAKNIDTITFNLRYKTWNSQNKISIVNMYETYSTGYYDRIYIYSDKMYHMVMKRITLQNEIKPNSVL